MTKATTLAQLEARLARIEPLINSLYLWTITIMSTLAEIQAQNDALAAAAVEAKADATRQAALVAAAVDALQGMGTAIADLQAQLASAMPVTQADLDAMAAKNAQALADLADANTTRDAADAALAAGTPAAPPDPLPAAPV